jgi:hypothetical protein
MPSDDDTDPDKTPRLRPTRPTVQCPFCRQHVELMPSGLLALHVIQGKWARSMCRGSGTPIVRR